MINSLKSNVGRVVGIFVALLVTEAVGQETEGGSGQSDRSAGRRVLEEVIVTTSKREESLMEVLGSVTAISSEQMARENIQDYQRLAELVPGMVTMTEDKIAIRGISRSREGPSPVAFHVNGVFLGERGEPFYDLEAVEIVRGPSGTVYGRNSTAGAINAKWKRPEPGWGWGVNLRYSSRTEEQIKGYFNVPLFEIDGLQTAARFAAMKRRGDGGSLDNLLAPDDEDPGNFDDQFVRMYLTSEITEDFQMALRAVTFESSPEGASFVRTPTLFTRASGDLERGGAQPLPMDITKVRSTVDDRFGENRDESNRVSLETNWSFHDVPFFGSFDSVFIGAYQWGDGDQVFDIDGTEAPIFDARNTFEVDRVRSAELRFASNNDTGVDWIIGVFWYKETTVTDLDAIVTAAPSTGQALALVGPDFLPRVPPFPGDPGLLIQTPVEITSFDEEKAKAFFLNFNFDLAKLHDVADVELTAGIRRNFDETFGETLETNISGPDTPDVAEFQVTTGELGLRWFYNSEGMLYTKFSRGYKPGFSQIVVDEAGNARQNPVDPEFLNAFELGWKAALLDRSLQMEVAGYYYDYGDLQVTQLGGATGIFTTNAAAATIFGIELGLQWMPTANLRLDFSASAMESTYDEYCGLDPAAPEQETPDPGCTEENPTDFSGETTQAAPALAASLSVAYDFALDELGTLTPSLRTSWSDELERRGLGNPHDDVGSYSTTDLRVTWSSPRRQWSVAAFVENLEDNTDTFFTAFGPVLVVGGTPNTFTLGDGLPPRVYGVSVDYNY